MSPENEFSCQMLCASPESCELVSLIEAHHSKSNEVSTLRSLGATASNLAPKIRALQELGTGLASQCTVYRESAQQQLK